MKLNNQKRKQEENLKKHNKYFYQINTKIKSQFRVFNV